MPLHLQTEWPSEFRHIDLHLTLDSSKFLSILELLLVVVTRKLLLFFIFLLFVFLLFTFLLFILTTLEACSVDRIREIAFSRWVARKPTERRKENR